MSTGTLDERALVDRHLLRMRLLFAAGLTAVPSAAVGALALGPREPGGATPFTLTLVVYAAALWIGLTASRDARHRLESAKRAFTAHGRLERLLTDHRLVYLAVLLRLEVTTVCGFVGAVWGLGMVAAAPVLALAALLVVQTWPTHRKTELLIARARALRND